MEKQQKTKEEEQTNQSNDEIIEEVVESEELKESKPQEIISDLTTQVEVLQDKLLRQLAESENVRTRSAKLIEEAREYAIFEFTKDLIPVIDNLQRALEHLPKDLDPDVQNVVEGVKMTKEQLESAFKKHHLESITPQSGDKFDYNIHHAISQVMTEEFSPGSIVNTM
ncbi:MAG: nucleotide exchange factor GrpE, partial [Rickettsiaceae bacterium]|nr:nucleotide exchange factor GrpE [Rickettsiaceae bacterium]